MENGKDVISIHEADNRRRHLYFKKTNRQDNRQDTDKAGIIPGIDKTGRERYVLREDGTDYIDM